MTDHLDDDRDDRWAARLADAGPPPPDLGLLAATVEKRGRRRRTARRVGVLGAAAASVAAVAIPLGLVGPGTAPDTNRPLASAPTTQAIPAPTECVPRGEADRGNLDGTAVWVRFCPGAEGATIGAEVPSDALVTHLASIDDLSVAPMSSQLRVGTPCGQDSMRRLYRLQIGYPDGTVAQVTGGTDPFCIGLLTGAREVGVVGRVGLGVYGTVMAAFGEQYADGFEPADPPEPMVCPEDPSDPDSVDRDGASAGLDTGFALGRRTRMLMPLTAVRGVLCTWSSAPSQPPVNWRNPASNRPDPPTMTPLSPADAERVRIGMHAIYPAMVDCQQTVAPTHTAVVEDRTGTRRAVSVFLSECGTVIRSDDGHGLGFTWLDRVSR